ncbi:MAG: ATPase domain-containing protein [Archaeoglobaceae archaeon]
MIPTGIEFLDKQIGGFHEGLVILYENSGAGAREFALTMLLNNAKKYELNYLAIAKTYEEIKREVKLSFPESKKEVEMNIISLAEYYFKDSIVPMRWVAEKASFEMLKEERNVLSKLIEVFDNVRGIVFLDSITDLARVSKKFGWEALIDLLKGFKAVCIRKGILLMGLLTSNVLERNLEEELFETADGVVVFEWIAEKDTITRWMFFRKMLGIMPILEKERVLKYSTKIDPAQGFTISRIMRVL